MDELKWLEVAVSTTTDRLDELSGKLINAGMTGLVVEDEQEFRQFLENNRQYWDYVDEELEKRMQGISRIKFYVTDDADGKAMLNKYVALLGCEYTVTPLGDNDWAYSWQKYYKPLPVGEKLYVVPEWERNEPVPEGKVPFYLNPGLTFGTGSHASTQLCLAGVEEYTAPGCSVLDLGCGSGILSIAALVLGARDAVAVDIDPKAVDVSYENAALNGIGRDRYTVRAGDVLVLLSDGVLGESEEGTWLKEILSRTEDSTALARAIVESAAARGASTDDKTALVLRIFPAKEK